MSRYNKVGKHKTSVVSKNAAMTVTYHPTEVVIATPTTITLNTGGWKTNTTKLRMNQAANQFDLGYCVYQHKNKWYVSYKNQTIPFGAETLILAR